MHALRPARSALLALALALGLPGCADGPPNLNTEGVKAAHGGTLLDLPGKAGFVELAFESTAAVVRSKTEGKVVAYFVDPSGEPLRPAPTDVTIALADGPGPVPMAPAGGEARFETRPMTLVEGHEVGGTLRANLGGRPIEVENRAR
jgi:hypothetical protein